MRVRRLPTQLPGRPPTTLWDTHLPGGTVWDGGRTTWDNVPATAIPEIELTPQEHPPVTAAGQLDLRVLPRPVAIDLTPNQLPLTAGGQLPLEVYRFVRSYVARLRQAAVRLLDELGAFTAVFDSRQAQIDRAMLPAARVYTSQTSVGRSINIPDFLTTTNLVVQIIAEDITDEGSASRVDGLVDETKEWLLGDPDFLQMYERITSVDTDIERNIEGESRTTIATISFAMTISEYYEPRVPDRLETIFTEIDMIRPWDPNRAPIGPDGAIEATVITPKPPRRK